MNDQINKVKRGSSGEVTCEYCKKTHKYVELKISDIVTCTCGQKIYLIGVEK